MLPPLLGQTATQPLQEGDTQTLYLPERVMGALQRRQPFSIWVQRGQFEQAMKDARVVLFTRFTRLPWVQTGQLARIAFTCSGLAASSSSSKG